MRTPVETLLTDIVERSGALPNHVPAAECLSSVAGADDPVRAARALAEMALQELLDTLLLPLPRPAALLAGLYAVVYLPGIAHVDGREWLRAVNLGQTVEIGGLPSGDTLCLIPYDAHARVGTRCSGRPQPSGSPSCP